MSLQILSQSYRTEIDAAERPSDSREQDQELLAAREEVAEGVRKGIERSGLSLSTVHLLGGENAPDGNGRVAVGAFDQRTDRIAMADVRTLAATLNPDVEDVQSAVAEQVAATLHHEKRHRDSWRNAKRRGEAKRIAEVMGEEDDRLLQELMASAGTEAHDDYDHERAQAEALASRIGIGRGKIIQLVYEGQESEVVSAAIKSGYVPMAA
jgi:hypothetical protein